MKQTQIGQSRHFGRLFTEPAHIGEDTGLDFYEIDAFQIYRSAQAVDRSSDIHRVAAGLVVAIAISERSAGDITGIAVIDVGRRQQGSGEGIGTGRGAVGILIPGVENIGEYHSGITRVVFPGYVTVSRRRTEVGNRIIPLVSRPPRFTSGQFVPGIVRFPVSVHIGHYPDDTGFGEPGESVSDHFLVRPSRALHYAGAVSRHRGGRFQCGHASL